MNILSSILGTIRIWGTDKEMKYQREMERLRMKDNEEKRKEVCMYSLHESPLQITCCSLACNKSTQV